MTRPYRLLSTLVNSSSKPPSKSPEQLPVQSDLLFIIAALLCALVCVMGLITGARCAWLRRRTTANQTPEQSSANKGMKKKHVEALPKFEFDSGKADNGGRLASGGGECVICLGEYVDGDEIRVLPQCGHGFHVGCIDTWLGNHSSCPSCRRVLVIGEGRCKRCGGFTTRGMASVGEDVGRGHNGSCSLVK